MIPIRDNIPTRRKPVMNYLATIIPLGYLMRVTMVPASIVLGLWFVLQLFSGVLSLGGPDVGGVAFWAHIGGFVAGMVMALLFGKRRRVDENAVRWSTCRKRAIVVE